MWHRAGKEGLRSLQFAGSLPTWTMKCTGKKNNQQKKQKEQKKQNQEKICVTRVHTIGDCELRSLLIVVHKILISSNEQKTPVIPVVF